MTRVRTDEEGSIDSARLRSKRKMIWNIWTRRKREEMRKTSCKKRLKGLMETSNRTKS